MSKQHGGEPEITPEKVKKSKFLFSGALLGVNAIAFVLSGATTAEASDSSPIVLYMLGFFVAISFFQGTFLFSRIARTKNLSTAIVAIASFEIITLFALVGTIVDPQNIPVMAVPIASIVSLLGIWFIVPNRRDG